MKGVRGNTGYRGLVVWYLVKKSDIAKLDAGQAVPQANAFWGYGEVKNGKARLGDKNIPVEGMEDGKAVAFVRPHDIVLSATAAASCLTIH